MMAEPKGRIGSSSVVAKHEARACLDLPGLLLCQHSKEV